MTRDGVVTRTYGRGGFLGLLSPVLSYVMASAGMSGWERRAQRDMEADALAMQEKGYRIIAADEYRWPVLGMAWLRVTYRRSEPAGSG